MQILDPHQLMCDYGQLSDFDRQEGTIDDKETLDDIELTDEQWKMLESAGEDYGFFYESIVNGEPIVLVRS
jgi:hypothetical protein